MCSTPAPPKKNSRKATSCLFIKEKLHQARAGVYTRALKKVFQTTESDESGTPAGLGCNFKSSESGLLTMWSNDLKICTSCRLSSTTPGFSISCGTWLANGFFFNGPCDPQSAP